MIKELPVKNKLMNENDCIDPSTWFYLHISSVIAFMGGNFDDNWWNGAKKCYWFQQLPLKGKKCILYSCIPTWTQFIVQKDEFECKKIIRLEIDQNWNIAQHFQEWNCHFTTTPSIRRKTTETIFYTATHTHWIFQHIKKFVPIVHLSSCIKIHCGGGEGERKIIGCSIGGSLIQSYIELAGNWGSFINGVSFSSK